MKKKWWTIFRVATIGILLSLACSFPLEGLFEGEEEWSEEEERSLERYRSPFEHSDEEIYKILTQGFPSDTRNNLSFLLSHVPPFEGGLNSDLPEGSSTGSKGITKFVMEFHPSRVLSGHYHSSHDFQLDSTPCNIVPAAKDGYYAILEVDLDTESHQLSIETFY